jgi:hypothetical protein
VIVNVSPEADKVAVGDSAVSKTSVPELEAVNNPTFATVTGNESLLFAVNVFEIVYVAVPAVCAYVPTARIKPPEAVAISPVNDVSEAAGVVEFAVSAM